MTPVQRIIRRIHVPYYALKLLAETWRAWGLSNWLRFWISRERDLPLTLGGLRFLVRGASLRTKMTDTFAIMETVHHQLYNRRFFDDAFQIRPGDTVVDIGGYIGSFALPAAARAREGVIYSFEPSPENFERFEINLRLNRLENVKVFNVGVASADRTIQLFLDPLNAASNSIYRRDDQGVDAAVVEREAISLPTLFARHRIERCDFLKIDCEGAEYEILMTLDRAILDRIGKIACEYHGPAYYGVTNPDHSPANLAKFLERHGFTVYLKPVNPYLGMLYAARKLPVVRDA